MKETNEQYYERMSAAVKRAYDEARQVMEDLRGVDGYVRRRNTVESAYFDIARLARRFGHETPPFQRPTGTKTTVHAPMTDRPKPKAPPPPSPRVVIADNADEDPKKEVEEYKTKRRKATGSRKKIATRKKVERK